MDIALVRIHHSGTSPRRRRTENLDTVFDEGDRFAGLCASSNTPLLQRIDPYNDLFLTSSEIEQLLLELDRLTGDAQPNDLGLLERIRGLALRCSVDPTLELHFEGD